MENSDSKAERLAFLEALIGRPYRIGATGPDAFDCYGLARHLQHHLFSYDLPELGAVYVTTLDLMRCQRQERLGTKCGDRISPLGVFAQHTVLTRHGVTSQIVERWPEDHRP